MRVKLADVTELIAGYAFKSKDFGDYKNKVVKITQINPPIVDIEGATGVDLSKYDEHKLEKYIARKGDFLLAMTGATIGKIGKIEEGQGYVNQRVLMFKPMDTVDKKFVYYILQGYEFSRYVLNHIDSESAQPNISANTIGKYEFDLPPLPTQRRIASILSSLDDKIELNRKMNENLEEQARAVFKSWFVDYEPWGGVKPEGWKEGTVGEIIEIHDSRRIPLSGAKRDKMKNKKYPYYGAASLMDYVDEYIFDGKYLLLGEDGTVVDDAGFPILQYVWGQFWVYNHAHILTGKLGYSVESLYLLFKETPVKSIVTGAVQPKISQANLKSLEVIIPPTNVIKSFNEQVDAIFSFIRNNEEENKSLTALRDTLLPRLISGEVDVSGMDIGG